MEPNDHGPRACVLVVEDDPALRNVIRFNLQQAGFNVVTSPDGFAGWSQLQQQPVDLIVTDMQMPRMSGMELCQKLRSDPRFTRLPVLMLTAKGYELDLERLRTELGIVEVMFKPFSPRQLCRSVAQHVLTITGKAL